MDGALRATVDGVRMENQREDHRLQKNEKNG